MLGCFSWTKRGTHGSLWSKRKGEEGGGKMGKIYRKKEKTIVIGYAYLSQGKHIASDQDRLVGDQRTRRTKAETEKMEDRFRKQDKSGRSVMAWRGQRWRRWRWTDGATARMNLDCFHSVNVSSALLPRIGVPPGWII